MQKLMETRCHQCQSITCFKILYYEFVNVHVKFQVLNLILIQKKNYTLGYKSESLIYTSGTIFSSKIFKSRFNSLVPTYLGCNYNKFS